MLFKIFPQKKLAAFYYSVAPHPKGMYFRCSRLGGGGVTWDDGSPKDLHLEQ
jgi:hypothetical protein